MLISLEQRGILKRLIKKKMGYHHLETVQENIAHKLMSNAFLHFIEAQIDVFSLINKY